MLPGYKSNTLLIAQGHADGQFTVYSGKAEICVTYVVKSLLTLIRNCRNPTSVYVGVLLHYCFYLSTRRTDARTVFRRTTTHRGSKFLWRQRYFGKGSLHYELVPYMRIALGKLIVTQSVKKWSCSRRHIHPSPLDSDRSQIYPVPHLPTVSLWRTFQWFSPLQAGEPSGTFPSGCPTKISHISFTFPHAIKHFYILFFSTVVITLSGEKDKSWSSSLCNFLYPHFTSLK